MISFLVSILLFLVVLYVVRLVVGELGLPPKIMTIVYLIIGLIALFYLLNLFGVYSFPLK